MMQKRRAHSQNVSRIAVTTGDEDGIGLEVACKALGQIGPQPGVQFLLCRGLRARLTALTQLHRKFHILQTSGFSGALQLQAQSHTLIDISFREPPSHWFCLAASLALKKEVAGIVTGPLGKKSMIESGVPFLGHTEYLRSLNLGPLFMAFLGQKMRLVLATDHLSIADVPKRLSHENLTQAISAAESLRQQLTSNLRGKPMALVGLNPHAGEWGHLGREELEIYSRVLAEAKANGLKIEGPLVPDAAFTHTTLQRHSVIIASYHDQGLIPFKMIHGYDSGVQVTLGLPFVRTSVDHGTATDLFAKNKAKAGSMKDALLTAARWVKSQQIRRTT